MEKQELEKYLDKPTREIAELLGSSQTNVIYWLRKHDLKTKRQASKEILKSNCLNCSKEYSIGKNSTGKYCSIECQHTYRYNEHIRKWKSGELSGHTKWLDLTQPVRHYVLTKYNNSCVECGWNELHPIDSRPLVEIDHIDGDTSNCAESNLRVLCPNCHSKTSTFGTRNKNSARYNKRRELRLITPIG